RVPLVEFMTDKGTNTRAKGHYGEQPTVDIKGTASMQPGDFYARANVKARVGGAPSYHGMIFRPEGGYYNARYSLGKRVGAGRQKVKALMTVSAPNMMNADEVKGKVQASAGRRAATAMEKAVDNAFQSAT
ncbi:MAG: hypothetical protein FWE98_08510, partial [Oscillospiraceae bacterium]|nr:hypothetical protein [Oscillospiraceae bacterium]